MSLFLKSINCINSENWTMKTRKVNQKYKIKMLMSLIDKLYITSIWDQFFRRPENPKNAPILSPLRVWISISSKDTRTIIPLKRTSYLKACPCISSAHAVNFSIVYSSTFFCWSPQNELNDTTSQSKAKTASRACFHNFKVAYPFGSFSERRLWLSC